MIFVDTHTHIYSDDFSSDLPEAIQRAIDSGIRYLMLPNIDSDSISQMLKVCHDFPETCFPMMGLHPSSVKKNYQNELNVVETWLQKEKFYAIGEIGIDLYWDKTYAKEQEAVLIRQMELAVHYKLPVVIHMRRSFDEVWKIIKAFKNSGIRGVFHCFSGSIEQAKKVIELGYYIGVGGVVTYKNSGLAKVVDAIPAENILLETDAPYLPPVPFRGRRNESAYILNIAEKIADIKGITIENLAEITTKSALDLFKIK